MRLNVNWVGGNGVYRSPGYPISGILYLRCTFPHRELIPAPQADAAKRELGWGEWVLQVAGIPDFRYFVFAMYFPAPRINSRTAGGCG